MATFPVPTVHAPFAFIPLNEKVYFPPNDPKPSHDVPLAGGLSGRLKIKLTAKTPILVGGERKTVGGVNHIYPLKVHVLEGGKAVEKYGFEGSTLRGAIREVLEIASFGKVTRYNEQQRWIRDLTDKENYINSFTKNATVTSAATGYPISHPEYSSKVHTAWLYKSGLDWKIVPCKHARIDKGNENLQPRAAGYFLPDLSEMTLELKYTNFNSNDGKRISEKKFEGIAILDDNIVSHKHHENKIKDRDTQQKISKNPPEFTYLQYQKVRSFTLPPCTIPVSSGQMKVQGTLVLTASMNKSKHMDWVFYSPSAEKAKDSIYTPAPIDAPTIPTITQYIAYMDSEPAKSDRKKSWEFRKKQLVAGKINAIPIFYVTTDGSTDITKMRGMGLTQLFHIKPIDDRKKQISADANSHHSPLMDLAESMFGVKKESGKDRGLAGRVRFKAVVAMCDVTKRLAGAYTVILESPKEYAPLYGKQNIIQNGQPNAAVSQNVKSISNQLSVGYKPQRKRYPARPFTDPPANVPGKVPDSTLVIHPLPVGTVFETEVVFHNLSAVELGALIWALELGFIEGDSRHSIGLAKTYGFGQVVLTIEWNKSKIKKDKSLTENPETRTACEIGDTVVEYFEQQINNWLIQNNIRTPFQDTPTVNTLLQISNYLIGEKIDTEFGSEIWSYMSINHPEFGNEFADAKNTTRGSQWKCPKVMPSYLNLSNVAHGV